MYYYNFVNKLFCLAVKLLLCKLSKKKKKIRSEYTFFKTYFRTFKGILKNKKFFFVSRKLKIFVNHLGNV